MIAIETARPTTAHFLKITLLASVLSTGCALLLVVLLREQLQDFEQEMPAGDYLGIVIRAAVIGPAIETLVMASAISLVFKPVLRREIYVIIASALAWAALHGAFHLYWGVVAFLPFVVLTKVYLMFLRHGVRWAFAAAFANHALHNFFFASLVYALPDHV